MSEEIKEKEVETTSAVTEEVVETAETADKAAQPAVKASADGEASFEELLNESFKENENSKVVTGTVVRITPTEVFVDVPGRKQTGVVAMEDLSSSNISKCEDEVSVGDQIQLVVIDLQGNIKEQYSLNEIVNEYNGNTYHTNYHDLLDAREDERLKARQSWQTIENIKELKEGYLSQVIHKITQLMVKYHAIVVLEDLNMGFMRVLLLLSR